jgi:tetratricopeptide (TPR) repeat protein
MFFAFAVLFFLVFLIYSNTLDASWHLDDFGNITQNSNLHIQDLNPGSIYKTFFAYPALNKKLYRPIPCLSFALNWYFGKDHVVGFHIVNILIHFLTAFFLFLTILSLFDTPNIKHRHKGSEHFIALLAAVLWAINPIQTQAVTYIVQRMASMAALFYILSIYLYIKGKIINSRPSQIGFFVGCLLSFLFALGCKENTITLPVVLLLVEICFFQDLSIKKTRKVVVWISVGTGSLAAGLGALFFFNGDFFPFLSGYAHRPFTVLERLMTEPRIIALYITQILYPVPHRLSIEHDIDISNSLFVPWTTIPAILIVLLLIVIGFSQARKRPIVAFAILFFFLNHIVESTIIPLELVFEHRNYLPSLFLFFPISLAIKWTIDYYHVQRNYMWLIIVTFVIFLLIGLGTGTYLRNMAWATEKSLWEDALAKAPGSKRACHNLAGVYYHKLGFYGEALRLYNMAAQRKGTSTFSDATTLRNMAAIYYEQNDKEKAVRLLKKAVIINPRSRDCYFKLVSLLMELDRLEEVAHYLDALDPGDRNNAEYLNFRGLLLLKQKNPAKAIAYFRKSLNLQPNYKNAMVNIAICFDLTGAYRRSEWFLRGAHARYPRDVEILLWLIKGNLEADDKEDTTRYLNRLFSLVSVKGLISSLKKLSQKSQMENASQKIVMKRIAEEILEKSKRIGELD